MELKKVALNDIHVKLGAKMVPFAGFNMPVRYSSDKLEHLTVRNQVGIFDVSHMGEFLVQGTGAAEFLQKLTTNNVAKLVPGKAQYTCLPNEEGGIVDDLIIYMLEENSYMLVVNASNIEKDWKWINGHNDEGAELENVSDEYSLFAVQGPKAVKTLQKLTKTDLSSIKFYHFEKGSIGSAGEAILSATGYTGAGGFELYIKNEDAPRLWEEIMEAGEEFGIKPIGLGARDTLRMEMGYCLYGNDIDDTTSPIEAGLGWITKFDEPFINSEAFKKQKEEGVSKKLVGFKMIEKGIPRKDYEILNDESIPVGRVTSGTMSPSMDVGIGLGYVTAENSKPGTGIFIQIRNKKVKAEVSGLPLLN